MGSKNGWARVWAAVKPERAPKLRRGAWYPILNAPTPNWVVLDADPAHVTVPKRLVEIRPSPPGTFTMVYRRESEYPLSPKVPDHSEVYAVCPASRSRFPVQGQPDRLTCPECGHTDQIAWWETG